MGFNMKIVMIWVMFGYLNSTKALRYACPSNAWCVPGENCNDGSVVHVYNAKDSSRIVEYVCGVISTEDYVCCAETGLLNISTDFTPSRTNWFYPKENVTVIRGLVVLPWPGHEATEVTVPDLKKPPPICPSYSVCVPPAVCPAVSIRYSGAVMGDIINFQYQCGHTWDTVSWTCCSVHIFINAIHEALNTAPVVAPRFAHGSINAEVIKHSPRIYDYSKTFSSLSGPRLSAYSQTRKRREISASDLTDDAELENGIEVNDTVIVVSAAIPFELAPDNGTEFSGRSAEGLPSQSIPNSGVPSSCGKPIGQGIAAHQSTPYNTDLANAGLTREGQYPWHVAILTINREYLCGGTIVADRHVITVAHCVDAYTAQALRVRVGDYDLTSNTENQPSYDVELASIVFHPNYTKPTLKSDLAVLVLKFSVLPLKNVARVCFPGEGATSDKQECYVPGWGSVTPARQGSPRITNFHPVLKDSGLVLVGPDRCEQQLRKVKSLGVFFKLLPGVTCAKGLHQRDSCHGDGGSGLVCRTVAGEFVLQGLISWSAGCDRGLPTALVDVGFYGDFILNVIKGIPFLGSTSFSDGTSSNNSRFGFNFQGASSQSSIYGNFQQSSFNNAQSSFSSAYQSSFGGGQQVSGSTQQSGALFGQYSSGNAQQTGSYAASSSSSTAQTEQSYKGAYASASQGINTQGAAYGSAQGAAYGSAQGAAYGSAQGAAYGSAQGAAYGSAQGAAYGSAQGAAYGSAQGAAYGSAQGAAYGSAQGAAYGSAQGAAYGSAQGATYGSAQGAAYGSAQGAAYGSAQGATQGATYGSAQGTTQGTTYGSTQETTYGSAQGTTYGSAQGTTYGSAQGTTYGSAQGTTYGSAQGTTYGSAQGTTYGSAQGTTYGSAQGTTYGSAQGTTYGSAQGTTYGSAQGTTYGSAQGTTYGSAQGTTYGSAQGTTYGSAQGTTYGSAQGTTYGSAPGGIYGNSYDQTKYNRGQDYTSQRYGYKDQFDSGYEKGGFNSGYESGGKYGHINTDQSYGNLYKTGKYESFGEYGSKGKFKDEYDPQEFFDKYNYRKLKHEANLKRDYYDGFSGAYDGYPIDDHKGRYDEPYFDTFEEYLGKYDKDVYYGNRYKGYNDFGYDDKLNTDYDDGDQVDTGYGYGYRDKLDTSFGYSDRLGSGYGDKRGSGTGYGYGNKLDTGYDDNLGTGYGDKLGTGYGDKLGTGYGDKLNTGYGSKFDTSYGDKQSSGYGYNSGYGDQEDSSYQLNNRYSDEYGSNRDYRYEESYGGYDSNYNKFSNYRDDSYKFGYENKHDNFGFKQGSYGSAYENKNDGSESSALYEDRHEGYGDNYAQTSNRKWGSYGESSGYSQSYLKSDYTTSNKFDYEKEHNTWHNKYKEFDTKPHEAWHVKYSTGSNSYGNGNTGGTTENLRQLARQADQSVSDENEPADSSGISNSSPEQSIVGYLKKRYVRNATAES